MRRLATICLAAAALAVPAASALAQPRPDDQKTQETHRTEGRKPPTPSAKAPASTQPKPGSDDERYGRWDAAWGAPPPAPPKSFARPSDWRRHVRACQQRYRTYNPRTDTFVARPGVTRRCTL